MAAAGAGSVPRRAAVALLSALLVLSSVWFATPPANAQDPGPSVLVFHDGSDTAAAGLAAIEARSGDAGIVVDDTTEAADFTAENLAGYAAVVFLGVEGDVLNGDQEAAFQAFVQGGGGFVGAHEVANVEPSSSWFTGLIGSRPGTSPQELQEAVVEVNDRVHPATRDLPLEWTRTDRWLNWSPNPSGDVHAVAHVRELSYEGGSNGVSHPISWCRDYDGGRSFYTGMGATAEAFAEEGMRDHLAGALLWAAGLVRGDCGALIDDNYEPVRITQPNQPDQLDQIGEPHGLDIAPDGRVFYIGRGGGMPAMPQRPNWNNEDVGLGWGTIHLYDPADESVTKVAELDVFGNKGGGPELQKTEEGLLGIVLDPDFSENGWIYTHWTPHSEIDRETHMGKRRISRWTYDHDTRTLDLDSEQVLLEWDVQIHSCCHAGGDMEFDAEGNLYVATGDTNSSGFTGGYSGNNPEPQFAGVSFADARRTAGNTNDLNGKILRITPTDDGGYTIPEGNLFTGEEEGGGKTRPEIYVMGMRNPSRFDVDPETGIVYVGWVGPDAATPSTTWGPAKYDQFAAITEAGNHGWPYCMGNKQPYRDRNLPNPNEPLGWYDCDNPVNESPHNTGLVNLPPIKNNNIWYSPAGGGPDYPRDEEGVPSYDASERFFRLPWLRGGGQAAMGGPLYRFDESIDSDTQWPEYWDEKWFVGDYQSPNNVRHAVMLDPEGLDDGDIPIHADNLLGKIPGGNSFINNLMGWQFGPDGALYVLDYGRGFFTATPQSALWRIDYTGGPATPAPTATADVTQGEAPLTVNFSSEGSGGVSVAWDFTGDGTVDSTDANPSFTYAAEGEYTATLTVTYADGEEATTEVAITVGVPPEVEITEPPEGGMVDWGDDLPFAVQVTDDDDVDCEAVDVEFTVAGTTTDETTGCEGAVNTGDPSQTAGRGTLSASYGDAGEDPEPVYESIFDGTQESFEDWGYVGGRSMELREDGTLLTSGEGGGGGLGMLWYQPEQFGDFSLRFEWRDEREGDAYSNSGVFVRFPGVDPAAHPECNTSDPAWVAVNCGHEIQINDSPTGDVRKTGSVYGFADNTLEEANPVAKGEWSEMEIRVVGQTYTVLRDGVVINEFENTPGQPFPGRPADPGTDGRQFAEGYIGFQNHDADSRIAFRNIEVAELSSTGGGLSGSDEVRVTSTHQQAEAASAGNGTQIVNHDGAEGGRRVASIDDGDWLRFDDVNLTNIDTVLYRASSPGFGGTIELRAGAPDGEVLATAEIGATEDADTYGVVSAAVAEHTETTDLYLVFNAYEDNEGGDDLFLLDALWFYGDGVGDPTSQYETILGDSQESFDAWEMAGAGEFTRNEDGSITTSGDGSGLGLLWYPVEEYGDFSLKLRWKDDHPTAYSNAGVFVRFPESGDPVNTSINNGREIQIYDGPTGEPQKTGSVYNAAPLTLDEANPVPKGEWNDYEIRVVNRVYTVIRNGEVINRFEDPSGARPLSGYIGLQWHDPGAEVTFDDVRIKRLDGPEGDLFDDPESPIPPPPSKEPHPDSILNAVGITRHENAPNGEIPFTTSFAAELLPDAYSVTVPNEDDGIPLRMPDTSGEYDNVATALGQTYTLPTVEQDSYDTLHVFATTSDGQMSGNFTVTYTDGTSETVSRHFPDWANPQLQAPTVTAIGPMPYRHRADGGRGPDEYDESVGMYIYRSPIPVDPEKTVESVTLPQQGPGNTRIRVIGLTFQAGEDFYAADLYHVPDDEAPEVTPAVAGGKGTATVTLFATDALSGVNSVEYRIGDGEWQPYTTVLSFDEPGTYTVGFRATDLDLNVGEGSVDVTVTEATPTDPPAGSILNVLGITNFDNRNDGNVESSGTSWVAENLPAGSYDVFAPEFDENDDVPWRLPDTTGEFENVARSVEQMYALPEAARQSYDTLHVLNGATNGPQSGEFTLHYTDGSTETHPFVSHDWANTNSMTEPTHEAFGPLGPERHNRSASNGVQILPNGLQMRMYHTPVPVDADKQLAAVTLPGNTAIYVIGMTFEADGNFFPADLYDVNEWEPPAPPCEDFEGGADDEFDGDALEACRWTRIVRENADLYEVSDGALRITTVNSDFFPTSNPKTPNLILQAQPESEEWTATTAVTVPSDTTNGNQAGIVLYENDANWAKVSYKQHADQRGLEFIRMDNGEADISFEEDIVFGDFPDAIQMRIATDGTDVWGEYSTDGGETFQQVGRTWPLAGLEDAEIGVFALNSPGTTQREMAFDWFRVDTDDEPQDTTAPEVTATLEGETNDDGDYVGVVGVTIEATDDMSGVASIEYQLDDGEWTPYEQALAISDLGDHTVQFRATDNAGNVSEPDSVSFTIVEAEPSDDTAPEVTATLDGDTNDDGDYVGSVTVTLAATDDDSGVASVEYSLNGGAWTAYANPVTLDAIGDHTLQYRATDNAGNVSDVGSLSFSIVEAEEPSPCPEPDGRSTIVIGGVDTGVDNVEMEDGCTANDLIDDETSWSSAGQFLRHVNDVARDLYDDGLISARERAELIRAASRSGIGRGTPRGRL